jgi:2-(1,2-epoxy-1,2-dihydrophenyl)acetyl-CoA isomerase
MDDARAAAGYTVNDLFQRAFRVFADRTAVTSEEGSWTYAELGERAARLAGGPGSQLDAATISAWCRERLAAHVEASANDQRIRAIVLTGADGHFSAGGDAQAVIDLIATGSQDAAITFMRRFHRLVTALWTSDLPVIAAVSGVAYGGGFNLALACDLIIASADARFCQVFLRRGLVPDLGGAYLLPRLVGLHRAKELMLRAQEISAQQARDMGLLSTIAADPQAALAEAIAVGAELAARPGTAISLTKRLINSTTSGTLESALEQEALSQVAALLRPGTAASFQPFTGHSARRAE